MVGHVDHGKTTLTKALSGTWTDTHSEERKRGISIKLGYADTTFYCTEDGDYYAKGKHPEGKKDSKKELLRVVSFVDAPGSRNSDGRDDIRCIDNGWCIIVNFSN